MVCNGSTCGPNFGLAGATAGSAGEGVSLVIRISLASRACARAFGVDLSTSVRRTGGERSPTPLTRPPCIKLHVEFFGGYRRLTALDRHNGADGDPPDPFAKPGLRPHQVLEFPLWQRFDIFPDSHGWPLCLTRRFGGAGWLIRRLVVPCGSPAEFPQFAQSPQLGETFTFMESESLLW